MAFGADCVVFLLKIQKMYIHLFTSTWILWSWSVGVEKQHRP